MSLKKKRYDKTTPEAKTLRDEIVHGTFAKEGTFVAFPTCFPGASTPIRADESHITALDVDPKGTIYGGTSGRATHLFLGMFHGVTGMVFDMGPVEGADHCAAICCGREKFAACVNGPTGGRVITRAFQPLPFDLIQEWGFSRTPFEDLGEVVPGERILHAVAEPTRAMVVGITEGHLFTVDIEAGNRSDQRERGCPRERARRPNVRVVGEVPGRGRLAVGPKGNVFGLDERGALWRYDPRTDKLERRVVRLPEEGSWEQGAIRWARDSGTGLLYAADDAGRLFSFTEEDGLGLRPLRFRGPLGKTPLAPVGPMAVTLDGRVFGACGEGISRLFCYHPTRLSSSQAQRGDVRDLGVAVSVIERRRYGYVFGDAVVGRDGEIVFGEDDDLGHVWLYFPKIEASQAGGKEAESERSETKPGK